MRAQETPHCLRQPLYVRYRGHPLGESRSPLVGKLLALVFGLLFLGLAFMAQFLGGVLQASLTIFGAVGGPVLGFFSLGMFLPHANEPLWVVVLGVLLTLIVGAVASCVAGVTCEGDRSVPPPNPDLFVPPVRRALLARRGRRCSNSLQLTRVAGDLSNGVGPAADTKTQEELLNGIDGHHVAPV
ncbi:sodium-dependent multivitamin transporter-like [Schistocerca piceifrons]|uniref:sodium-dependent multivitamin transporter-like n=1 Tax=Schistocerca piceifrons TaxID=274613 RepID=UPI001F5E691E|nr:sodium-dependent multivitamin transporter-like [Schistocerca piceifrons]XP_049944696.1 sodium-dependent multivitamin transporter-like [Schistocerca serialis cubense]